MSTIKLYTYISILAVGVEMWRRWIIRISGGEEWWCRSRALTWRSSDRGVVVRSHSGRCRSV